ncbi:Na+/H+ antiporter subunit E [Arenibaculum pallidiluteum]|uniref:Na+/H+ antiporter subunit E n=1 Tax=Arenibaculum pallidiluteum TaxID=2812559 RepID=UPI001A978828|nr:Na+/H+ antiporter subunit E [Arenibaculum pallidiluteum]
MSRWRTIVVPAAGLLAIWLLLQGSLSPGSVILGAILATGAAWVLMALDPPASSFRRPRAALGLAARVAVEVVRSNWAVAGIILGRGRRPRTSGFVRISLDMRAPYGLAALACIITATPGTVWVEYDSSENSMLLHVLDLIDGEEWVRIIKERYEAPLMEIFE